MIQLYDQRLNQKYMDNIHKLLYSTTLDDSSPISLTFDLQTLSL